MVLERLDAERRSLETLCAGMITAAPLPLFLVLRLASAREFLSRPWTVPAAASASLLVAVTGLALMRGRAEARALASLLVLGTLFLAAWSLAFAPAAVLLFLLAATLALNSLWTAVPGAGLPAARRALRARGAAFVATFLSPVLFWQSDIWAGTVLAGMYLLAVPYVVLWLRKLDRGARWRVYILLGGLFLAALGALAWRLWPQSLGMLGIVSLTAFLVNPGARQGMAGETGFLDLILGHPGRLTVATFVILCTAGGFLLAMPWSLADGQQIAPIDALFTAVSAACVTGLTVVDTPTTFSFAGEFIVALLIQLGGLGIMTFSTAALRLLGVRMNLRTEGSVAGLLSPQDRSALYSAARKILILTIGAEALGALVLLVRFMMHGDGFFEALWRAIFTSVSAYCNAGFGLQTTNLVPYQTDVAVLQVVSTLIILGGMSPVAAVAIPDWISLRRRKPLDCQTRLVLYTTFILLVVGFLGTLALEWGNTLASLGFMDKLNNAWFHSVSTRTAGFNAISMEMLHPATQLLTVGLMFVGGSPGGTAGGIKTTTLAVLFAVVVAALRGREHAQVFHRRISQKTIFRALAVTAVGGLIVSVALLLLLLTQSISTPVALFEVVSALGTVGLSVGGTSLLDGVGKIIIMLCMFVGRVGPLSLFMLMNRDVPGLHWVRPEEDIELG